MEIAWAQRSALDSNVENIAIYDALNLADADGDGVKDTDGYGGNLASDVDLIEPVNNQTVDPDADDDSDGIPNKDDLCPETESGGLTDLDGCSSDQLSEKADASDGEKDTTGSNTMLIVMIIAAIFTGGAFLILKQLESKASDAKDLVSIEEQEMMMMDNFESANSEEWSMPVLDGSSNTSEKAGSISSEDLAKFPGSGEHVVQRYLDNGWTIDQLAEYYQEQLKDNQ